MAKANRHAAVDALGDQVDAYMRRAIVAEKDSARLREVTKTNLAVLSAIEKFRGALHPNLSRDIMAAINGCRAVLLPKPGPREPGECVHRGAWCGDSYCTNCGYIDDDEPSDNSEGSE